MTAIFPPIPYFTDAEGLALDMGQIYVGTEGLDPRANPIQVYWDPDLSIPATQPLRTIAGLPTYQGAATGFYVDATAYSITILDRNGVPMPGSSLYAEGFATLSYLNTAFNIPLRATGTGDDSSALTAALATAYGNTYKGGIIESFSRRLRLFGDFTMVRETRLDLGTTYVVATPDDRLFNIGWDTTTTANQIGRPQFFGGLIDLHGAGTTCFAVQNSGTNTFRDVDVNLRANGQIAYHLKACDDPDAPYYGLIDGVRVRGNATPGAEQYGFLIEGLPVPGSITVNRWHIDNVTDCAAVDYGFDIRGADGLCLSNINMESCYSFGMRFGYDNRSYTGAVTTPGSGSGSFIDTGLIGSDLDQAATIKITSGPNSGHSSRIIQFDDSTGEVTLPFAYPELFTAGDTFTITEAKARSIKANNVTFESGTPSLAAFYFTAGCLDCRIETSFVTLVSGTIARRDIEELGNTVASRYDVFEFEAQLASGTATEWLDPAFIASNQGGAALPQGGFVDAVIVTGSVRVPGSGSAGTVEISVFAGGAQLSADMTAKLTEDAPNYGRRIRQTLADTDFISQGTNIQVRAETSGMALGEYVRVAVYVGYL